MNNFLNRPTHRVKPLYWLPLVLMLFIAGQLMAQAHWHDAGTAPDNECSLCLLALATAGAAVTAGWQFIAVQFTSVLVALTLVVVCRSAVRFHDSQAPPALLNFNV